MSKDQLPIKLGLRGEKLIKQKESLKLTAYLPTPNDVWTIGWGSTRNVKKGMVITAEEAEDRFKQDTEEARLAVQTLCSKCSIQFTESMIDALISLVYNCGSGAISSSSTIGRSLIWGDIVSAWRGFALWTKQKNSKGVLEDLVGLAIRRGEEMNLFLQDYHRSPAW